MGVEDVFDSVTSEYGFTRNKDTLNKMTISDHPSTKLNASSIVS